MGNSAPGRSINLPQLTISYGFALILLAHVLLGAIYAFSIPMGEAYDEQGHYAYLRYLAEERQLPRVTLQESFLTPEEDLQFSQPPLYYLLGALATFWIPAEQELPLDENPHLFLEGLNRFIHPPEETDLYREEFMAILGGRLVSILLSTLAVAATYFLAKIIFPRRSDVVLTATSITAFCPMYIFMGSVVNNDVAVTAFSSLFILYAIKSSLYPAPRHWFGMAFFLGLALLSKYNALALLPIAVLALLVGASGRSAVPWRSLVLRGSLLASGIFLFAMVWWFVPENPLFGGPLRRFPDFMQRLATDLGNPVSLMVRILGYLLSPRIEGTFISFWGVFGWANIPMDNWIYTLIALAVLLSVTGWLRMRGLFTFDEKRALAISAASIVAVLFTGVYRELGSQIPVVGRYLLLMLSPLSLILAGGLALLSPRLRLHIIFALGLFLLALIVPFRYLRPAYAVPARFASEQLPQIQTPLQVRFGEEIRLLGYELDTSRAHPEGEIEVTLYLKALRPMAENYTLALHLLDPAYQALNKRNTYPGRGNWPTSLWRQGEIIQDIYTLRIPSHFPAPAQVWLKVAFFLYPQVEHLQVWDDRGQPLGNQVLIGPFAVHSRFPQPFEPMARSDARVNDLVRLRGYSVVQKIDPPQLEVLLGWEALRDIGQSYTVFVHLLDEKGNLVTQHDSPPRGGAYPTNFWLAGERVVDEHIVPLPESLSPGRYRLMVGLYDPDSLTRLAVFGGQGDRLLHDLIPLGEIVLKGNS